MSSFRRCLQEFTWIALLAMLGLALAPAVSHASSGSEPWSEICSTAAPGSSGSSDSPAGVATHLQHCPLCGVHVHAEGLPPSEPVSSVVAGGAAFIPALIAEPSRPLFAWTATLARAPPADR